MYLELWKLKKLNTKYNVKLNIKKLIRELYEHEMFHGHAHLLLSSVSHMSH